MIFYRITKKQHASDAWTGNGAKLFGGRWNHKGYPAVYVSSAISLACLEILVHAQRENLLDQYRVFSIEIPDNLIEYLEEHHLPDNWRRDPAPISTMDIGTGWLNSQESLALIIPSTIIPAENNAILNPLHPRFSSCLKKVTEQEFVFDKRFIK